MTWTLLDDHNTVVAGPFVSLGDALRTHQTAPYVRINKAVHGRYDVDAGFSASDHVHYHLVDSSSPAVR